MQHTYTYVRVTNDTPTHGLLSGRGLIRRCQGSCQLDKLKVGAEEDFKYLEAGDQALGSVLMRRETGRLRRRRLSIVMQKALAHRTSRNIRRQTTVDRWRSKTGTRTWTDDTILAARRPRSPDGIEYP